MKFNLLYEEFLRFYTPEFEKNRTLLYTLESNAALADLPAYIRGMILKDGTLLTLVYEEDKSVERQNAIHSDILKAYNSQLKDKKPLNDVDDYIFVIRVGRTDEFILGEGYDHDIDTLISEELQYEYIKAFENKNPLKKLTFSVRTDVYIAADDYAGNEKEMQNDLR